MGCSDAKDQRQVGPEIGPLAAKAVIKVDGEEIFRSLSVGNNSSLRHGRSSRRFRRLWTLQYQPRHFAHAAWVSHELPRMIRSSQERLKEPHRFSHSRRREVNSQLGWKPSRLILLCRERHGNTLAGLGSGDYAKRTRARPPVRPTFPELGRSRHFVLRLCTVLDPEELKH